MRSGGRFGGGVEQRCWENGNLCLKCGIYELKIVEVG